MRVVLNFESDQTKMDIDQEVDDNNPTVDDYYDSLVYEGRCEEAEYVENHPGTTVEEFEKHFAPYRYMQHPKQMKRLIIALPQTALARLEEVVA